MLSLVRRSLISHGLMVFDPPASSWHLEFNVWIISSCWVQLNTSFVNVKKKLHPFVFVGAYVEVRGKFVGVGCLFFLPHGCQGLTGHRVGWQAPYPLSPLVQLSLCLCKAGICSCCHVYSELLVQLLSQLRPQMEWVFLIFVKFGHLTPLLIWDPGKRRFHAPPLCLRLLA